MQKYISIYILLFVTLTISAQEKEVSLKFVETSDIHGHFYPYNFLEKKDWSGSLARVYSYIEEKRKTHNDNLILIDNGDILHGQPSVYYYNFIDTVSPHLCAEMMNYMRYDIGNIGNHDIEPGRRVFERWAADCNFPVLGANVIDISTEEPFLKPYEIIEREGVKVAILGMVTPAIPVWLPENLWKGLRFDDMEKTAKKWIKIIKKNENPDLIIGLFHAGQFESLLGGKYRDNASLGVARKVPGFDIVMMGHDHILECKKIISDSGDTILVVNPANDGMAIAEIDVTFKLRYGKVQEKIINGAIISVDQFHPNQEFLKHFHSQYETIQEFLSKKIGTFEETLSTRQAYFGPSSFVDFIHSLQLQITGADISFAAPLAYDAEIKKGDITVTDMFTLYKFENLLYTMRLSGKEIKKYLEESYDMWIDRMKSPNSHLLKLKDKSKWDTGFNALKYFSYNFDSAAGIIYTVDVTKRKGSKINITAMADGTPFDMNKEYTVVINSYRGNGGGELLTKGAGIPQDKIKERIITSTDKDMRYYLMNYIQEKKILNPQPLYQWKFIPEEWTIPAGKRDYDILFNSPNN